MALRAHVRVVHAEVTELLSNVIYQHRRRAGQGGRSPRKESPLGRAVVWRVLGWSQARCGFEGRRRSQGRKQHGSFQLIFAGSQRNPTCHRSSPLFPLPSHHQRSSQRRCGPAEGEGQRAPCHRAPLTHTRCSITYKPSTTKQQPPPQHTERTQHTYSK